MDPKLADKLMKIRQVNSTWQTTLRRAPIWITPKKQPAYRPFSNSHYGFEIWVWECFLRLAAAKNTPKLPFPYIFLSY